MAVRIVRLGSPRSPGEGLRIGTVRRPPRGVPKAEFATRDFYDVWLPELAPSPELVGRAQAARTDAEWAGFVRAYRTEMSRPRPGTPSSCWPPCPTGPICRSAATARRRPAATGRCFATCSRSAGAATVD